MLLTLAGAIGAVQLASAEIAPVQTASSSSPWYIEGSGGALLRFDATEIDDVLQQLGNYRAGNDYRHV